MRKHWLIAVVAVAALALASSNANANNLTPGTSVSPDPFTINLSTATVIADTGVENYTGGAITGTFREEVLQESPGAGYTFVYQVHVTAGDLGRLSSGGWTNATSPVDVGTVLATATNTLLSGVTATNQTNASSVDWSTDKSTLGFNFTTGGTGTIPTGNFSELLIVRTTNTSESAVPVFFIDSGTASVGGFAPGPVVTASPEPSTMVLAGLGALGFFGYALRRRKASGA